MLRKGVCPYEYIDETEKFRETSMLEKYINLNMEDITDVDYMHAKIVCKDLKKRIKNLGEYHELYLKSDTLLFVDVLKTFEKLCLKTYHLDHLEFLSALLLSWQVEWSKTNWYLYAINGWKSN